MLGKLSRTIMCNNYEKQIDNKKATSDNLFLRLLNKIKNVKTRDNIELTNHYTGLILTKVDSSTKSEDLKSKDIQHEMREEGYNIGLNFFSMNAQNLISELKKESPDPDSFRKVVTNISGILVNTPKTKDNERKLIETLYEAKIAMVGDVEIHYKDLGDLKDSLKFSLTDLKKEDFTVVKNITEKLMGVIAPLRDFNAL